MARLICLCSLVLSVALARAQDVSRDETIQRMENECRTIWEQLRDHPETINRLASRPKELVETFARMLFSGRLTLAYHSFDAKSFATSVDDSRIQAFLVAATDAWRSAPKLEPAYFDKLCGIFQTLIELGHPPPADVLNVIRPIYESYSRDGICFSMYQLKQAAQTAGFEISQSLSPDESREAVSAIVQQLTVSPLQKLDLLYIPIGGLSSPDAANLFQQVIEQALARPDNWHVPEAASRLTHELAARIEAADAARVYLFAAKQVGSADKLEQRFLSSAAEFLIGRLSAGFPPELFPELLQTFLEPSVVLASSWSALLPKLSDEQRHEIGMRVLDAMQKVNDEDFLQFNGCWTLVENDIGANLQRSFAIAFVSQCSTRYRDSRDRRFLEYIALVTPPESEHQAAIQLAVEALSQPESLNNDKFVFALLRVIEKLEISDLEAIVAAIKRDLAAKARPTTSSQALGYEHWRTNAIERLDLCYDQLDMLISNKSEPIYRERGAEVASTYLAQKFQKLSEDLGQSNNLLSDLLDLFGPGRPFETPREREAGLIIFHRQLERMRSDLRRQFIANLIERYQESFPNVPLAFPKSHEPAALAEYFTRESQQRFGDAVHQKTALLLIGTAQYMESDQSIELLCEFAKRQSLRSAAGSGGWGKARPGDQWLDGLDEAQLTLVGERLGSQAFKSTPEIEGVYAGPASEDRRTLEDLFSVFKGKQEEWLFSAVLRQCDNAFEVECLKEIKRTYKWRFN